jgi:hypothetical protein
MIVVNDRVITDLLKSLHFAHTFVDIGVGW